MPQNPVKTMKKKLPIVIALTATALILFGLTSINSYREKKNSRDALSEDAAKCQIKKTVEDSANYAQKALTTSPDNKTYKEYADSSAKKLQEVLASCDRVENWERKYGEAYRP